jgi:hypothetical protein
MKFMRLARPLAPLLLVASLGTAVVTTSAPRAGMSVLFIGNSFTFGEGSATHFWRPGRVTDLNNEGVGGVPALFKAFADEAGIDVNVALETHPGVGLDWHLANKREVLAAQPYDVVVMHGYSTLDAGKPGDPAKLVATVKAMSDLLSAKNPKVAIYPEATWSRADQTYPQGRPWFGKPIEAMALDVRAGYDKAAAGSTSVKAVIPVGQAWNRAIASGVADPNPYDGIDAGKVDLWTNDHYHASTHGYYLTALTIFATVTHRDPRWLGASECAAYELGVSSAQARALQQVAFDQVSAEKDTVLESPAAVSPPRSSGRCK